MKSSTKALLIVIGIVGLGAVLFFISAPNDEKATNQPQSPNDLVSAEENNTKPSDENTDEQVSYSLEEVAMHNTSDNCWTVINNNVYNITSYIPRHSGGNNILSACGVDATSFFNGEQPGQLGGVNDHSTSSSARSQLEQLKIGTLK